MIVFAILGLLIGLLFMFVRQKLSALESRVNLLTDTVQTMAGFRRIESDTEDDTDEESESDESEAPETYFPKIEEETYFPKTPVRMEPEPDMKVVSDDEVEIELNEINEVKKIQLEGPDYENLSLKELKDKVAELGGPKLRTKKELLDFLKNIM